MLGNFQPDAVITIVTASEPRLEPLRRFLLLLLSYLSMAIWTFMDLVGVRVGAFISQFFLIVRGKCFLLEACLQEIRLFLVLTGVSKGVWPRGIRRGTGQASLPHLGVVPQ